MPIYEYRCPTCGVFDVMQKITAKPLRKCPTCKGKVSKLISSTAFQLKGTGWYVTDYGSKGKASGDGKEPAPATGAKSETSASTPSDASGGKPSEGSGKEGGSGSTATPSS